MTDVQANSPAALIDMITGYSKSQIVRAAIQLKVADHLADGPRTAGQLNERLGADLDALTRFLRVCGVIGLVERRPDETFALTALGDFLRSGNPAAAAISTVALGLAGPGLYRLGEFYADVVMTGRAAAPAAFGQSLYDFFADHPEHGRPYDEMWTLMSESCARAVADAYDFSPFRTIVDVGGGHGLLLSHILRRAPHARGVVFDLPPVVEAAKSFFAEQAGDQPPHDRVDFVAGNFHEEIPGGGDLYTIKTVLCDWDDAAAARVLANLRAAAGRQGRVLVIDSVMPDDPQADPALVQGAYLGDFSLLAQTGGRMRTMAQWRSLVEEAGFAVSGVIAIPDPPTQWDALELLPR